MSLACSSKQVMSTRLVFYKFMLKQELAKLKLFHDTFLQIFGQVATHLGTGIFGGHLSHIAFNH